MTSLPVRGVLLAFTACSLHAWPVYVERQNNLFPYGSDSVTGQVSSTRSGTFNSGVFGLDYSVSQGGPDTPFNAVCMDANQNLFTGTQLYYVESLVEYTTLSPSSDPPAPSLTAAQRNKLAQLFTVAWADVTSSAPDSQKPWKSAGFQWAVWNIVRDSDNDLNDDSSNVQITGSGDDVTTRYWANNYLSQITASTPMMYLYVWSPVQAIKNAAGNVTGYMRISGQELLTPVPEPAFFGLLAVGLIGLYWKARSRRNRERLGNAGAKAS